MTLTEIVRAVDKECNPRLTFVSTGYCSRDYAGGVMFDNTLFSYNVPPVMYIGHTHYRYRPYIPLKDERTLLTKDEIRSVYARSE